MGRLDLMQKMPSLALAVMILILNPASSPARSARVPEALAALESSPWVL